MLPNRAREALSIHPWHVQVEKDEAGARTLLQTLERVRAIDRNHRRAPHPLDTVGERVPNRGVVIYDENAPDGAPPPCLTFDLRRWGAHSQGRVRLGYWRLHYGWRSRLTRESPAGRFRSTPTTAHATRLEGLSENPRHDGDHWRLSTEAGARPAARAISLPDTQPVAAGAITRSPDVRAPAMPELQIAGAEVGHVERHAALALGGA